MPALVLLDISSNFSSARAPQNVYEVPALSIYLATFYIGREIPSKDLLTKKERWPSKQQMRVTIPDQEFKGLRRILEPTEAIDKILPVRKHSARNGIVVLYFLIVSALVVYYRIAYLGLNTKNTIFTIYGFAVTTYLMSRFIIVLFYKPTVDQGYRPRVSIVIPAMNEEEVIKSTLLAAVSVDYPKEKLEIVVVDDGSTDNTWGRIREFCLLHPEVGAIWMPKNMGKREAMARGIEQASGEILIFIDSDTIVDPKTFHFIVQDFADQKVAAVTGRSDVYNSSKNMLTKMQTVRYFTAFQIMKACESVFNSVTCCSGCFSAYRKDYVLEVINEWRNQTFLGIKCTYGDDRSLTNKLLKKYKIKYNSLARAYTVVPDNYRKFFKQQLRWKKSWTRESLIALTIFWKKHPVFAISAYLSVILPLLSPLIVTRSFLFLPITTGVLPWLYLLGIYIMALLFGLFYCFQAPERSELWVYGTLFSLLYCVLAWQTYYAVITVKDPKWGTRG